MAQMTTEPSVTSVEEAATGGAVPGTGGCRPAASSSPTLPTSGFTESGAARDNPAVVAR
jgi:hypothetical protein